MASTPNRKPFVLLWHVKLDTDDLKREPPSKSALTAKAAQRETSLQEKSISFRETLEFFAGQHNIQFKPLSGRTHSLTGKPLFAFGHVTLYLDNHVVWVPSQNEQSLGWQPVSFDELLNRAKS